MLGLVILTFVRIFRIFLCAVIVDQLTEERHVVYHLHPSRRKRVKHFNRTAPSQREREQISEVQQLAVCPNLDLQRWVNHALRV